jgi:flagellar protein FliL
MAEQTTAAPQLVAGAKGGSKLVVILLAVNLLLVAGVLALVFLKGAPVGLAKGEAGGEPRSGSHGDSKAEGGQEGTGATTKLADFVVHLRDPEADRYARISFEVELSGEPEKVKFERYMPRVRDGFIAFLSDRTLEDLRGSEQVKRQKNALQEMLRELAPGVKVRGLYITDLVIQ